MSNSLELSKDNVPADLTSCIGKQNSLSIIKLSIKLATFYILHILMNISFKNYN